VSRTPEWIHLGLSVVLVLGSAASLIDAKGPVDMLVSAVILLVSCFAFGIALKYLLES
jgi:hypothetical protein